MNVSASLNQTAVGAFVDDLPVTDFPRILYDKNPLELVICQLRFPPILKIEAELPSEFQEAVRSEFPLFSDTRQQVGLPSAAGLPPELSKLLGAMLPTSVPRNYEFSSSDGNWQITLSRESIALTCRKYRRWEEFRRILAGPVEALVKHYAPAFFTRIGLRYRDLICRSELGLNNVSWNELLRADLAGEFHSPIESNIKLASHQLILSLNAGRAQVLIQHGIGPRATDQETCYYIDNDFSTEERRAPNDAMATLDYFSKHSWRLFRWCIAERLHNAMGPRPIDPRHE